MIDGKFLIQLIRIVCIDPFTRTPEDALNFRMINREYRDEVDRNLWFWIHDRFIPCIVGLPYGLKPYFYVKLLQNYFFGTSPVMDARYFQRRVGMLIDQAYNPRHDRDGYDAFVLERVHTLLECYASTAHGRDQMSLVLDAWEGNPQNTQTDETHQRLAYIRRFLKFAFVVAPKEKIFIGLREKTRFEDSLPLRYDAVDFSEWKVVTAKKPIGFWNVVVDFFTSLLSRS